MTSDPRGQVTRILDDLQGANRQEVFERLLPLVYDELRLVARARLSHERQGHTLQATALVHEAYIRLLSGDAPPWNDRAHFFRAAAEAMRRILIDHARGRQRGKRGGDWLRVTLTGLAGSPLGTDLDPTQLLALHAALEKLAQLDERQARVVELRFFAGMPLEEVAQALGISEATVKRDWALARAWLLKELGEGKPRA